MTEATPIDVPLAAVHEAIAASRPDEYCLVFRDRRFTWQQITDRTRRLANALLDRGLGCHTERSELANHVSGQDHLAIYLHNGNEYLESMLGALKARVCSMNVNYRYVAEELHYLLTDAQATAIVVHSQFAPTLAEVLPQLPHLRVILQVDDESGNDLLPGAVWYEDALAAASPERPAVDWSGDDLYMLYTGGTTGMPKGVMWRNGDAMVECFGGSRTAQTVDGFVAEANTGLRALLAPPFMHGAGHWMSFRTWLGGGTVFVQSVPERLDPTDVWSLIEHEGLNFLLIVGDAFARPLLDELESPTGRDAYDLSSLTVLLSGGAALSAPLKNEFLQLLPTVMIVDGLGSSEAGGQVSHVSAGGISSTGTFELTPGNVVLSADLDRVLEPTEQETGWLAKTGRLALGYLGDEAKTQRTYPIVTGRRYAVPGDRARFKNDNPNDLIVELHGRDAVTINSGGEKIFAEEVEAAIKAHPAIYDCVVAGRPSDRWGSEVVAVVRIRDGHDANDAALLAEAQRHIARYKLPKAIVRVEHVVRSPSGKADYRWAKTIASR
ncbi:acyl-CoA synthetase [uncultured Ilumatobacter sp.]|uniref:acyl-CoA synthetase n=1 Tax=uncultured Ilumatobacter sp. TaxID=879968 RepID=UPI00374F7809|tara:strand:- start:49 stop:1704 length:1656 start_codon:yes stop_codon:yes gene_type:complete